MTVASLPPGLILVIGSLLLPWAGRGWRLAAIIGLPALTLLAIWQGPDASGATIPFLDYQLQPVRSDALGRLFATIFAIMAFGGGLFALNQERTTELVAGSVYAGSAIGVALAGDLVTAFIFWEIMAVGSTVVIWSARTESSYRSSVRYMLIHLLGGVVLMVGIIGQILETGSVEFQAMQADSLSRWLILAGFLLNAGAPPLSAWLPDAYPEASWSGTVYLSAFTTKTAVYVLLRGFPGTELLVYIGLFMAFYGIVYALLENDMRRILAYSIINQVGFMVTGIGIGTEMSLNGAAAHAFTHIIYKGLLLMSAGSVLYMTGKRKCTDLGGLFQSMPLTTISGIIGALAISSFPWTSGFVSKSMTTQGAADENMAIVWFLLTAASAGVFLHAGIKFPWFVFFQKDSGLRPPDPPWNMRIAMVLFAALSIGIGIWPQFLYALLPYPVEYVPYTVLHVVNTLQLLLFAGLAFFVMLPMMRRTLTITLDVDWFYRVAMVRLAQWLERVLGHAWRRLTAAAMRHFDAFIAGIFRAHGPQGILARTWPTGSTVLWVAVLLGTYLVLYNV